MFPKINFLDVDLITNLTSLRHSFMFLICVLLEYKYYFYHNDHKNIFIKSMDYPVSSQYRNSVLLEIHNWYKPIKSFHELCFLRLILLM